jgi:hypothetical protein
MSLDMSFMPFYAMDYLDGIDDGHNYLSLDMMGLFFCILCTYDGERRWSSSPVQTSSID